MTDVKTDTIHNGSGTGSVAQRLLANGMNPMALRTNAVLRKDEWVKYDTAVVTVARQRLNAVMHLMERCLTFPVENAMGITRLEWENMSHMEGAEISMSGVTRGRNDRVEFTPQAIPLPIIHKDFFLNIRHLTASRNTGQPLDTTQAEQAARLVSEATESLVFNGATITSDGSRIFGYLNAPNRNVGTLSGDWSNATAVTGEQIVRDILAMVQALEDDHYYGPYGLYVPTNYYNRMLDDYKANSDRTILERVLALPPIDNVWPSEFLPPNNVVMVTFQRDVVDLVEGFGPTMIDWETEGGMQVNFKIMSIMVPRVKADAKGQSGIAHFSV